MEKRINKKGKERKRTDKEWTMEQKEEAIICEKLNLIMNFSDKIMFKDK